VPSRAGATRARLITPSMLPIAFFGG
jgi:hypothetical protein